MGLATLLAVATLWLWVTGRLPLYINPSSDWLAVPMAVLVLVGAVLSFLLPPGAEADHGHDHGHGDDHRHGHDHAADRGRRRAGRRVGAMLGVLGGVAASAVALAVFLVPPAALSAEIAQQRDTGAAPLFAGADRISLAVRGDTAQFGVGDWASVFATATDPASFEGDKVTLTGFVTPAAGGGRFSLTRLVITHCVIDAQPASVPVDVTGGTLPTGAWVEVVGTVRADASGGLQIEASDVRRIAEPKDPYEY